MIPDLAHQLATLKQQTIAGLRARYAELFGEQTQAGNRAWLIKRIAWRLQALAEGDLSQRARQRALELARDADLRLCPPRSTTYGTESADTAPIRTRRRTRSFSRPRSSTRSRLLSAGRTIRSIQSL